MVITVVGANWGQHGTVADLMRMPHFLLLRLKTLVHLPRDHVLHPNQAGVLGGGIVDQTLANIYSYSQNSQLI
jgi:hypothetical protein